jgi:hypothetical protein
MYRPSSAVIISEGGTFLLYIFSIRFISPDFNPEVFPCRLVILTTSRFHVVVIIYYPSTGLSMSRPEIDTGQPFLYTRLLAQNQEVKI